ncbi:MAG: alkaline phosphatase family protein, partial [Anaerolineales bacterium]
AETIFDHAIDQGYPATSLWWPATFPARLTSPVFSIPGLGTPDITGKLGVGIFYSQTGGQEHNLSKTQKEVLIKKGNGEFTGTIPGPKRVKGNKVEETNQAFTLKFLNESSAQFSIGKKISFPLKIGAWSPVFEINFKMGLLISLKTVTRVILSGTVKEPQLYFLPLQIHPLSSAWPYGSPRNLVAKTWREYGPFLTLGWPQDTTGLEEGLLTDEQFLTLCDSIITTREQVFLSQLERFNEGVLGIVFDTLDRVQHMFWKTRPDIIEHWYLKLDALVGRIEDKINTSPANGSQVLVLSDHGFKNFDYKVNLNKWLLDNGYLNVPDPQSNFSLDDASWTSSQAYAVGLNSLYLNQQGREAQGIV